MATNIVADTVRLPPIQHDLIHDIESKLQTSEMLELQQTLTNAEPDHGKWMRISPEGFAATGLLDLSGAEYLLVKWDGPNFGVFVFGLGKESDSVAPAAESSHTWVSERHDPDGDDPDGDDPNDDGGHGNHSPSHRPTQDPVAVPDGGLTAIFLGLSFLGLDLLRRKFSNN